MNNSDSYEVGQELSKAKRANGHPMAVEGIDGDGNHVQWCIWQGDSYSTHGHAGRIEYDAGGYPLRMILDPVVS